MYKTIIFDGKKYAFCIAKKDSFKTVKFKTWYNSSLKDCSPLHVKEGIEDSLLTGKSMSFMSLYIWHTRTNKIKFVERIKTLIK